MKESQGLQKRPLLWPRLHSVSGCLKQRKRYLQPVHSSSSPLYEAKLVRLNALLYTKALRYESIFAKDGP